MLLIHCAITAEILTGKWNICCMFSTTVNQVTAPYTILNIHHLHYYLPFLH